MKTIFEKLYEQVYTRSEPGLFDDIPESAFERKMEWVSKGFSKDKVDGELFGRDNRVYDIDLKFDAEQEDITGFEYNDGPSKIDTGKQDNLKLTITEYDDGGSVLRDDEDIKEDDPDLYEDILEYSIDQAAKL